MNEEVVEERRYHRRRLPRLDTGAVAPPPHTFMTDALQQLLETLAHPQLRVHRHQQQQQADSGGGRAGLQHGHAPGGMARGPMAGWDASEYSSAQRWCIRSLAGELMALALEDEKSAEVLVEHAAALADGRLQRLLVSCRCAAGARPRTGTCVDMLLYSVLCFRRQRPARVVHAQAALEAADGQLLADFLRVSVGNVRFAASMSGAEAQQPEAAAHADAADTAATAFHTAMELGRSLREAEADPKCDSSTLRERRRAAVYKAAASDDWPSTAMPLVFRTRVLWTKKLPKQHPARQLGQAWQGMTEGAVQQRALEAAGGGAARRLSLPQQALLHALQGQQFRRTLAMARLSQQHAQEGSEQQEEQPTEAGRYAELVAGLGPLRPAPPSGSAHEPHVAGSEEAPPESPGVGRSVAPQHAECRPAQAQDMAVALSPPAMLLGSVLLLGSLVGREED
eukprot:scaffold3.g6767.t1